MLRDCVSWPQATAQRYRDLGVWLDQTIDEAVSSAAQKSPDKIAIVTEQSKITYAELDERSDRLADGLYDAGLRPGDRIVVQLPNNPEFAMLYLAASRLGVLSSGGSGSVGVSRGRPLLPVGGKVAASVPPRPQRVEPVHPSWLIGMFFLGAGRQKATGASIKKNIYYLDTFQGWSCGVILPAPGSTAPLARMFASPAAGNRLMPAAPG